MKLHLKGSEKNLQNDITELKVHHLSLSIYSAVLLHICLAADFLFDLLSITHIFMFHCAFWLTGIVGIFSMCFSNFNFYEVPYYKYKQFRILQQRCRQDTLFITWGGIYFYNRINTLQNKLKLQCSCIYNHIHHTSFLVIHFPNCLPICSRKFSQLIMIVNIY